MISPEPIKPILIAGFGRSGTTALMSLLRTDPRVVTGPKYPFEDRWLTYAMKCAAIVGRQYVDSFSAEQLAEYDHDTIGPPPWQSIAETVRPSLAETWQQSLVAGFFDWLGRHHADATHYAEKAPAWLADALRPFCQVRVIHLVRDPRDAFISARDFVRARKNASFGIDPKRSDGEQVREVTRRLLAFAECTRVDRGRTDAIDVRYEDWVQHPRDIARRLSEFLSLELKPESSDVTAHLESHRTSASPAASVGRWRREPLPKEIQAIMLPQLLEHFDHHGYERLKDISPPTQWRPQSEWHHSPDAKWQSGTEQAELIISAGDAWIELPTVPFRATQVAEIWLCVRGSTGDHNSVYWRGPGEPFAQSRSAHLAFHPGPHWQVIRIPVHKHVNWRGTIEQLRVDVFNGAVQPGAAGSVRWIRAVS